MKPYEHKTQYYETDQMGIIHHSNYIRWFESARMEFMEQMGLTYKTMEDAGIGIPVLSVNCEYRSMVRFGDTVLIDAKIRLYNSIKLTVTYEVRDKETGELRTTGSSSHCFLSKEGKPVYLKKEKPEWDAIFRSRTEPEQ